jgi:Ca-activated chloride channel family protein
MSAVACEFTGINGEMIALKDVSISAVLRDLLADVTVHQTYRNNEQTNIEAVYTFPLPVDAVLLDFDILIGDRHLKGAVVEKRAAEKSYEDAIESGDAAVMLEQLEPGVYTMNVGNLRPRETVTIGFRYAMLYRWTGDRLRVMLPTTIAERYGTSPHLPHQIPETSLFAENRFSIQIDVVGVLQTAQFDCPSHTLKLIRGTDTTTLSLIQERTSMDRDFVLNIKAPQGHRSFLLTGRDGNGVAALASFQPFFPGLRQNHPLSVALVIDCSGSMQGDSIAQASQAVERIIESLGPSDRFTIIKFGSTTELLWKALSSCTPANRDEALRFAQTIQASMGGTEIAGALELAYSVLAREAASDILLVTDGEVSAWHPIADQAKRSGHRIFTVGVGNAVSEAFVRELASETGGECELVSPREAMAERIIRHFERMRSPRAKDVKVTWPRNVIDDYPSTFRTVFDGDTVVGFARFANTGGPESVALEAELETGETIHEELSASSASVVESREDNSIVARLAAHARLKECGAEKGLATALHYRLLSPWTNWIAVVERPDGQRALDIPAIRKVPQTPARMMLFDLCRSDAMPSPPRSPRVMPVDSALFKRQSPRFAKNKTENDSLAEALIRLSNRGVSAMIEFFALVPNDEWRSLSEWASEEGHYQLAQDAFAFWNLLDNQPVAEVTETQVCEGLNMLMYAIKHGFELNAAIVKAIKHNGTA